MGKKAAKLRNRGDEQYASAHLDGQVGEQVNTNSSWALCQRSSMVVNGSRRRWPIPRFAFI
jgi:hypothetical protein